MDGTNMRQGFAAFRLLPYITRLDSRILTQLAQDNYNSDDNDDDYYDDRDADLF